MDDDKAFWDWIATNGGIEKIARDWGSWKPETTQGTPVVRKVTPAERREALRGTPEWNTEYLANLDEPEPEPLGWYRITIPEEDEDEAE